MADFKNSDARVKPDVRVIPPLSGARVDLEMRDATGRIVLIESELWHRVEEKARTLGISDAELLQDAIEAALAGRELAELTLELNCKADELEAVLAETNREIEETRAYFAAKRAA
jgi:hypothetical protein